MTRVGDDAPGRLLCFGHRGALAHAPENTLKGVERGVALGADWIEIDVQLCADGRAVVIHDRRLERCTSGRGLVADTPWAALRALDAGDGERIPLLDEVFECVGGRAGLNVEIKGPGAAPEVVRVARRWVARGWPAERLLLSSFDHRQLADVRRLAPELGVGVLLAGVPLDLAACAEALGARSVNLSVDFLDAALIEDARRRALRVYVYTVNELDDIDRCRRLGVDGVFSDYPERVVRGASGC